MGEAGQCHDQAFQRKEKGRPNGLVLKTRRQQELRSLSSLTLRSKVCEYWMMWDCAVVHDLNWLVTGGGIPVLVPPFYRFFGNQLIYGQRRERFAGVLPHS